MSVRQHKSDSAGESATNITGYCRGMSLDRTQYRSPSHLKVDALVNNDNYFCKYSPRQQKISWELDIFWASYRRKLPVSLSPEILHRKRVSCEIGLCLEMYLSSQRDRMKRVLTYQLLVSLLPQATSLNRKMDSYKSINFLIYRYCSMVWVDLLLIDQYSRI